MSVVVVGLNHNSAPVDLLERLAITDEELPKALHQLLTYDHVLEGAVLSTCNRIEVYACVSKFHGGAQDLRNFLAEFCHVAPEDFTDRLYTYHDDAAIRHLFRVSAGIDSMVVGESEILGQVRRAFTAATEEGSIQRVLGSAFRKAMRAGKRARTETGIGRNPVSISSAAVDLARKAFEGSTLAGKKVAIVGAGKMGKLAAQALSSAGASDVTVVNRSQERAQDLAAMFGAVPLPIEELPHVLVRSDIVITSTTAPDTIVDKDLVEKVVAQRGSGSPLFIVDIAVPRDVEASVRDIPGVVLRDIDDLRGVVDAGIGNRLSEVSQVEQIIGDEVNNFIEWQKSSEIAPTITELIAWAESIRQKEMERLAASDLSPEQLEAAERSSKRIVAKLLHPALEKAKELASSKQGHTYLTALRELFELDDEDS
ncbi:MAG: glutamyl-tRNA reductase [Actinomycetota bacterium]|jgi:glutamyl-tRNA reductase|nr:glutamyl-tRNA reductase [Actinomycetota bacterium]